MILLAAFGCFMVTAISGMVLLQVTGWKLLLFGLAGLLGAFFYTGRPISYKYRALGELMLGILVGPVIVMGAYFVQTSDWDWAVFLISASLGMLISSISLVNNLRDMPDDRASGIQTLPMFLGISHTKRLYYVLTVAPYLAAAGAVVMEPACWPIGLAAISVPQAVTAIRALSSTKDDIDQIREKALTNPYPLNSIRLHARFGALVVVGLLVAAVIRIVR
jgi:1,4-dihydroxy-2-naphthoate octaprenyltransferase